LGNSLDTVRELSHANFLVCSAKHNATRHHYSQNNSANLKAANPEIVWHTADRMTSHYLVITVPSTEKDCRGVVSAATACRVEEQELNCRQLLLHCLPCRTCSEFHSTSCCAFQMTARMHIPLRLRPTFTQHAINPTPSQPCNYCPCCACTAAASAKGEATKTAAAAALVRAFLTPQTQRPQTT
jgi:hypothetical protein